MRCNSNKTPCSYFLAEIYKNALKFMGPRIFKTVLRNNAGDLLSKIKTYYKATIIKSVVLVQWNQTTKGTEMNPGVDLHICN